MLSLAIAAAACGGGGSNPDAGQPDAEPQPPDAAPPDAEIAPVFRNPVDMPDDQLAQEALRLLGAPAAGGTKNCNDCHSLTRQSIRWWRALSDVTMSECLTDLAVSSDESARTMLECLRQAPPDKPFVASKAGVYTTAATLDWFEYVFRRVYPDTWQTEHAAFVERIGMPKGNHAPFTQGEFDIVAEWFVRGVPMLDDVLPNDPAPTTCTPGVSADVATHVNEMALSGWRAVNAENSLLMHGCAGAPTTLDCLSTYPLAGDTAFGVGWDALTGSKLRVMRENGYSSAYWTRSSADGRFVAHGAWTGGSHNAMFIDLLDDREIPADAFYDPGFFPDNSGFVFQAGDALFCEQRVLSLGSPATVEFNEPGCTQTNSVGLYQHVGAALGGGDYWAVDSEFVSDDGGHSPTDEDPAAWFGSQASMRLTTMVNDGFGFMAANSENVSSRYEGDIVISPSSKLLASRVGGQSATQLGYVLRRLDAVPDGTGGYTIDTPEIARYCFNGGKVAFSYDERWMVTHHYVTDADAQDLGFTGAGDPAFQPYRTQGAANLYLIDLLDGTVTRFTMMNPGQYALYPHFRSDGWIYFIVREANTNTEYVVASDAALVLEGP